MLADQKKKNDTMRPEVNFKKLQGQKWIYNQTDSILC